MSHERPKGLTPEKYPHFTTKDTVKFADSLGEEKLAYLRKAYPAELYSISKIEPGKKGEPDNVFIYAKGSEEEARPVLAFFLEKATIQ